MTTNPLDAIQARADAATEGPWEATPNDRIVSSTRTWPEGDPYDVAGWFGNKGAVVEACRTNDANFIAHAREDVPKLVAALRAVEAIKPWNGDYPPYDSGYNTALQDVRAAIREALA